MILQADLISEMERRDRLVTARNLTDWRAKGLLPRMQSKGRGTGRGKIYYWPEPDIVERTQFVFDAYANNAKTDAIKLMLVYAGFSMSPKVTRSLWIKRLKLHEQIYNPDHLGIGENPEDKLWDAAGKISPSLSEQFGVTLNEADTLALSTLKIHFSKSKFRLNEDELREATSVLNSFLKKMMLESNFSNIVAPQLDEELLSRLVSVARSALSVTATKETLRSSAVDQFEGATIYLRKIVTLIIASVSFAPTKQQAVVWDQFVRQFFRSLIGPPLIAFLITLIGEGYEPHLKKSEHLIEEYSRLFEGMSFSQKPKNPSEIPEEFRQITNQLFEQLRDIWHDFSVFRLYHMA